MATKTANPPLVGIIMGSDSDWPTLQPAAEACAEFGVPYEVRVMSARRTLQGRTAETHRP